MVNHRNILAGRVEAISRRSLEITVVDRRQPASLLAIDPWEYLRDDPA